MRYPLAVLGVALSLVPTTGRAQPSDDARVIQARIVDAQREFGKTLSKLVAAVTALDLELRQNRSEQSRAKVEIAELVEQLVDIRRTLSALEGDLSALTRRVSAAEARPPPSGPATPAATTGPHPDLARLAAELKKFNDQFERETRRLYPDPPTRGTP